MQNVIHRPADFPGFQDGFAGISRLLVMFTWLTRFRESCFQHFWWQGGAPEFLRARREQVYS
jgi:hypothetical protein